MMLSSKFSHQSIARGGPIAGTWLEVDGKQPTLESEREGKSWRKMQPRKGNVPADIDKDMEEFIANLLRCGIAVSLQK